MARDAAPALRLSAAGARDLDAGGAALAARALTIEAGARRLVAELSFELRPGEFVAILGRNGSGKTLTLHTLAGLDAPRAGEVLLDGAPLRTLRRRHIAQRLALLMQAREEGLPVTVLESVLVSRHPHLKALQWEGASDHEVAQRALRQLGLAGLAGRSLDTLSGGEQQRVAIAALLAQATPILLLDEPINHLDPRHEIGVLGLFRELTRAGSSVLAALHDPSLAARFADRVLLLYGDGRWRFGPTEAVLTAASLGELYGTPMLELQANGRRLFVSA